MASKADPAKQLRRQVRSLEQLLVQSEAQIVKLRKELGGLENLVKAQGVLVAQLVAAYADLNRSHMLLMETVKGILSSQPAQPSDAGVSEVG